ncbi:MAG: basic amino acid/polyamine antiporter, family [Thermoplasmata archaeon]|jgi:amino acid transporter|nr:basic amino acid/polyamine antiporter, family [Thermoplasmata archaeon]
MAEARLPGRLSAFVAGCFVVGYVVGLSTIGFLVQTTPSMLGMVLVLLVGALYTGAGSLVYAELSTRVPRAGGEYAYVERAFGPRWGFFRAWAAFAVVLPATLALIAQIDVQFLEQLFGALTPAGETQAAMLLLAAGFWANAFGVKASGRLVVAWAAIKAIVLAALVAGAVWVVAHGRVAADAVAPATPAPLWPLLVAAVPIAMLLYDGSYDVVALAEDLQEPRRALPRALLGGLAISFLLFALMGVATLLVLGFAGADGNSLGVFAGIGAAFGPGAQRVMLALYFTVGSAGTAGILLAASRYAYGAARDGHFFRSFAALHPRLGTPVRALGLVLAFALAYTMMAGVRGLVSFYISALGLLSLLAVAALFRLRRRGLGEPDHFRAPGGAWLPLLWAAATLAVTAASLWDAKDRIGLAGAAAMLLMLGLAFPIHWAATRRRADPEPEGEPAVA